MAFRFGTSNARAQSEAVYTCKTPKNFGLGLANASFNVPGITKIKKDLVRNGGA